MKPDQVLGTGTRLAWLAATLLICLNGCAGLPIISSIAPTPVSTPAQTAAPLTPTPLLTPQQSPQAPQDLTIWLPPEFNPSATNPGAVLLRDRLDQFSKDNGINIKVRIKAASGLGSLLESLNAASAAAPTALPGVIALPRLDLEAAAVKGQIYPLDGVSSAMNSSDWFDYAHQLALVQGATFGLPFAGDAMLIVYRPSKISVPPATWDAILRLGQPLAFPANSQQSLTTILLYQSLGGEIEDSQRRPVLKSDLLGQVFTLYRQTADRGVFPTWLSQYDSDAQVWQIYQEKRVDAVFTWSSFLLSSSGEDSAVLPIPSPTGKAASIATGWVWAVTDPIPERRAQSIKLIEWLSASDFLSRWSEVSGYLPTRPSALASWKNQNLKAVLSQVASAASARPSNDLMYSLGPVLREASIKVIRLEAEPLQAAADAADRLTNPPQP
jgi:multiple sugar transport system substrate-binding protein